MTINEITKIKTVFVILIILLCVFINIACSRQPRLKYEIVDLGTLGGTDSSPRMINDAGLVIGESEIAVGNVNDEHSFLWDSNSGMIDLTTLIVGKENYLLANSINNSGQVVGAIKYSDSDNYNAFLWDRKNGLTILETPDSNSSWAKSINDLGQVAGILGTTVNYPHVFIWDSNNGMTDLGTHGEVVKIEEISNKGQIVANVYPPGHAFLWNKTGGMVDLGTLGGEASSAYAINNAGQVVGYSHKPRSLRRACLWNTKNNQIIDLGVPWGLGMECMALGINDSGQVVGWYGRKHQQLFGPGRAFFWEKKCGVIPLSKLLPDNSGWKFLIGADDINNRGQIVGCGETNKGERHAFLMTPVSEAPRK